MIEFKFTDVKHAQMSRALSGEGGKELIATVTDQIVLNSSLSPEDRAGAGLVLSLLRSLANDTGVILQEPKP